MNEKLKLLQAQDSALFAALKKTRKEIESVRDLISSMRHDLIRKYYQQLTPGKEYSPEEFAFLLQRNGECEEAIQVALNGLPVSRRKYYYLKPQKIKITIEI